MTSIRTRKRGENRKVICSQNQGNVPAAGALSQPRVSSIAGVIALICFLAAGSERFISKAWGSLIT